MTTITVKVNGDVRKFNENTVKALHGIIVTQNPASKTVQTAVNLCGGVAYVAAVKGNGKPSDVVEVYEDNKLVGRGVRSNIAAKMEVCLTAEKWLTESFGEKTEKALKDNSPVESF